MKIKHVSIFKRGGRNKALKPWLIAYGTGANRRVVTGSTDYADTVEIARHLSRISQKVDHGMADNEELHAEAQRRRPLTEHLTEWRKYMKAAGKTRKHIDQMYKLACAVLVDFPTIDTLNSSSLQIKVSELGGSGAVINRRVHAVRSFVRWGMGERWPESRMKAVDLHLAPKTSLRPRRVLSANDFAKLLEATEAGETIAGMTGFQRALLYRVMTASGLRLGEISRLTDSNLREDSIFLPAKFAKNRKDSIVRMPFGLMGDMNLIGLASGRLFNIPANPHRLMLADLKAAGIERQTNEGVFDFHSLRHQTATFLASAGAPAMVVKAHMRHASIKTTLDTYGHLFDTDRSKAALVLGNLIQRRAQRAGVTMQEKPCDTQWSQRELNPHLLNAIQPSEAIDALITLSREGLRNRRGRATAPRAAQRLLRRLHDKAIAHRK